MILGVFINGFKSYGQTAYIHLCKNDKYRFTTIVGKTELEKYNFRSHKLLFECEVPVQGTITNV